MCGARVWSRFVRRRSDGHRVKFRIQDVPRGRAEEAVSFMTKFIIPEEIWTKACGVLKNPAALEEMKVFWRRRMIEYPMLACCIDTGNETGDEIGDEIADERSLKIVGCNPWRMSSVDDGNNLFKEKETLKYLEIMRLADRFNTTRQQYGVNEYLTGAGIAVDRDFRCCGIATQLLRARGLVCQHLGTSVTAGVFRGLASQRAASRAGYETVQEVDYARFGELCGLTFQNDSPTFRFMALKVL